MEFNLVNKYVYGEMNLKIVIDSMNIYSQYELDKWPQTPELWKRVRGGSNPGTVD